MFSSGIMLRLGSTEEIEKQFEEGYIRFGCPANWILYARTQPPGVADRFEGIFAHVKKDDPRFGMICDDGYPLNYSRSLWNDEEPDGTVYARYVYSTLVPTVCFYSIAVKKAAKYFGIKGNGSMYLSADLKPYIKALNIDPEKSSMLVIRFPWMLADDLRREIPQAVVKNGFLYKKDFDPGNPMAIKYVTYDLDVKKQFWDLHPCNELFHKRPEFKNQREARIIIPNTFFMMDPVKKPDWFFINQLKVPVPNIKNYALVVPCSRCNQVVFDQFNEDLSRYRLTFRYDDQPNQ